MKDLKPIIEQLSMRIQVAQAALNLAYSMPICDSPADARANAAKLAGCIISEALIELTAEDPE